MKRVHFWVALAIFGLVATLVLVALPRIARGGDEWFPGGSYIVTLQNSSGNFESREVITFHADGTFSEIDSGQGGPEYLYSSGQGAWKLEGNRKIVVLAMDFDYSPTPDIARLDYTVQVSPDGRQLTGTMILSTFPLQTGNPLEGGGTGPYTYTLAGELIKP